MDVPASLVRDWYMKVEALRAADGKLASVSSGMITEKGQINILAERRELMIRTGLMVPNDPKMRDFMQDAYPALKARAARHAHVIVTAPSGVKIPVKDQATATLRRRVLEAIARLRGAA